LSTFRHLVVVDDVLSVSLICSNLQGVNFSNAGHVFLCLFHISPLCFHMNFPLHDIMSGLVMGGAGDAAATHSNS
jgi:hypothetical protein